MAGKQFRYQQRTITMDRPFEESRWQDCYWLRDYPVYEPCNDGTSEYKTGDEVVCEYFVSGEEMPFEKCKGCPYNP